jgi:hypothetical protein
VADSLLRYGRVRQPDNSLVSTIARPRRFPVKAQTDCEAFTCLLWVLLPAPPHWRRQTCELPVGRCCSASTDTEINGQTMDIPTSRGFGSTCATPSLMAFPGLRQFRAGNAVLATIAGASSRLQRRLQARTLPKQRTGAKIGCNVLNRLRVSACRPAFESGDTRPVSLQIELLRPSLIFAPQCRRDRGMPRMRSATAIAILIASWSRATLTSATDAADSALKARAP